MVSCCPSCGNHFCIGNHDGVIYYCRCGKTLVVNNNSLLEYVGPIKLAARAKSIFEWQEYDRADQHGYDSIAGLE